MPATIHRPPTNPRPNRQILLELPLEIWQDIFYFTTVIPQYSYGPETLLSPMSKDSIRMYRVHLKTRSRLVLVCKAWRIATLGLLYESIFLADCHALSTLVRTLEASQGQDTHALGSYARALVIRIPRTLQYHDQMQISSIVGCLPNLRYFGFSLGTEHSYAEHSFTIDKSVVTSLCTSCPDLEVIEAKVDRGVSFSANTWPLIFQSLRKLRSFTTLHIPQSNEQAPSYDATSYEGVAPLLSYLHICDAPTNVFRYLPPSLPSLRVLVFDIFIMNRPIHDIQRPDLAREIRSMLPVLEAHGRQLKTIILRSVYFWGPLLSAALHAIEEHCPHLETLVLLPVHLSAKAPPEPLILPSSVTRLCLRTFSHQATSNHELKAVFAALAEMRVRKLDTIRITDEKSFLALQTTHQKALRFAHSVFGARGWRFEGPDGELIA